MEWTLTQLAAAAIDEDIQMGGAAGNLGQPLTPGRAAMLSAGASMMGARDPWRGIGSGIQTGLGTYLSMRQAQESQDIKRLGMESQRIAREHAQQLQELRLGLDVSKYKSAEEAKRQERERKEEKDALDFEYKRSLMNRMKDRSAETQERIRIANQKLEKYVQDTDSRIMYRNWQAKFSEEKLARGTAADKARKEKQRSAYAFLLKEGINPLEPLPSAKAMLRPLLDRLGPDALAYMAGEGMLTDEQVNIMEDELGVLPETEDPAEAELDRLLEEDPAAALRLLNQMQPGRL